MKFKFFCHFRESDESFGLTQQIFRGVLYAIFLIYLFVGISGATTKSQRNNTSFHAVGWRHDTQHYDIHHNDIQRNDN
jgi:hypothetical protein